MRRDYIGIMQQYIDDVQKGRILTGEFVKRAVMRAIADEKRYASGGTYQFVPAGAIRNCAFIECLPHIKGEWAARRERLYLEPWQIFIQSQIYGWVKRSDGTRRYRRVYEEVARKNAKSTIMSANGIYMLCADGEQGAEIYALATSKAQASIVWRDAARMVKGAPGLRKHFGVESNWQSIYVESKNSLFMPKPGIPGDGDSPHFAIIDEYHEHKTSVGYDAMYSGMGARRHPLIWVITTAGHDRGGPCYLLRDYAIKVLEGVVQDESFFAMIYALDEGDNWSDQRVWIKANPNLGVSVSLENLQEAVQEAISNPAKQVNCLTKRLNTWCSTGARWMNMTRWDEAISKLTLDELSYKDLKAWIGMDLASKIDMCALAIIVELDDNTLWVGNKYYIAEQTVIDNAHSTHANVNAWAMDGYVTLTVGSRTDFAYIKDDVLDLMTRFNVVDVGFDPFHATQIATELAEAGVIMVSTRKVPQTFSEAMKETEARTMAKTLLHETNPCTAWMISNVEVKEDRRGNIFPYKGTPDAKIDGADAMFYAMCRWMHQDRTGGYNPYDDPSFSTAKIRVNAPTSKWEH